MNKPIRVGNIEFGTGSLVVVAGPCVLESLDLGLEIAASVRDLCKELGFGYVFKSSFDKANRTSITSYRGPGVERGLEWLETIRKKAGVPVLTDIHEPSQAAMAAKAVDILQIPAFLCRQTDLLVAAARTGRVLNIKKAQFMAPEDMAAVLSKCAEAGNDQVVLCERGTSFGYHQLVVDMRSLAVMRALGAPVMFDATHSVQTPGGKGTSSGGDRRFVLPLARAAVAVGVDSLFLEVHPDPDRAKSDGPNMVPLKALGNFLEQIRLLDDVVRAKLGPTDLEWVVKSGYGQSAE
jgi:2-dehydro-3-deoxyphosphooctonate aldolase (KDO 8-P synthase)